MASIHSLLSSPTPVKPARVARKIFVARIRELAEKKQLRLQALFSNELVNEIAAELGHRFRNRIFDPAFTLGLYVSHVLNRDESCSVVATRVNKERKADGLEPISTDGSGYCYARSRLPRALVSNLIERTVSIARERQNAAWMWHDRDVLLVDGFTLQASDTDANQSEFPQTASQEAGLGFPMIRAVTLTSLACRTIEHFAYGPMSGKGSGELGLFRQTFESLKENQVIVGDANFDSYYDLAALLEHKIDVVFGINGTRDNPFEGEELPRTGDITRVLRRPRFDHNRISREAWENLPETITIRIIGFESDGRSETKVVVTTLLDQQEYSAEEISLLYRLRWEAELDIRCLKSVMDLAHLRCQTPDGLRLEIEVNILAYNLVAILMCDTAETLESHPRELSFSHARDVFISLGDERQTPRDLEWLLVQTADKRIKNRPRRDEPRKVKDRGSKYSRLTEPRPSKKAKLDLANASAKA